MKNETRKQIYFLGSLWNISFAFDGLVMPKITMWFMSSSRNIITGTIPRTFFALYWALVGIIGWGYFLVSRDPDKNHGIIWVGCVAKVVVFLTFTNLYIRKKVTIAAFLGGLGDLVWTVLFLAALKGEKAVEKTE